MEIVSDRARGSERWLCLIFVRVKACVYRVACYCASSPSCGWPHVFVFCDGVCVCCFVLSWAVQPSCCKARMCPLQYYMDQYLYQSAFTSKHHFNHTSNHHQS